MKVTLTLTRDQAIRLGRLLRLTPKLADVLALLIKAFKEAEQCGPKGS